MGSFITIFLCNVLVMVCTGGSAQGATMAIAKIADYLVCLYKSHGVNNSKQSWVSYMSGSTNPNVQAAVNALAYFIIAHGCIYVSSGPDLIKQENQARASACAITKTVNKGAGVYNCGSFKCDTGCTRGCSGGYTRNNTSCTCGCIKKSCPTGMQFYQTPTFCGCQCPKIVQGNCTRNSNCTFTWAGPVGGGGVSRSTTDNPLPGFNMAQGCGEARKKFCNQFGEGCGYCFYQAGNCKSDGCSLCWISGGHSACFKRTGNNVSDCSKARALYCANNGKPCGDGHKYCWPVGGGDPCAGHGGGGGADVPGAHQPPPSNDPGQDGNVTETPPADTIFGVDPTLAMGGAVVGVLLLMVMQN